MNPHELPSLDLFHHRTPLQLRFSDVDVLGHVNNTVYFAFFDTGKAHYFTAVRGEQVDWKHVDTVIANVNCAFISSIVFGEEIEVLSTCLYLSEKSFKVLQLIREVNTGEAKAICETVMVCIDPETHEARPIPDKLREAFTKFEGRDLSKKNN
ncbi:MAG: acyl-CoA thioesterase [Bacteroides sp.]|nr:acyl-CoA thioesterase [Bacteroides sp.]